MIAEGLRMDTRPGGQPRLIDPGAASPSGLFALAKGREQVWFLQEMMNTVPGAQQYIQHQQRLATVGQLMAGIAHDINNLLAVIIGSAQMLQMNEDVPGLAQTDLACIVKQGQQAARLVRQILDFARQSSGQPGLLDLGPFLEQVTRFLKHTVPESVTIVLEKESGEYPVNADPTQLQQVLTNLALNARDAMPDGGRLRFRLSRFTLSPGHRPLFPGMQAGEWIALSVSDTGVGIPTEVFPHIFEPFFTTKQPGRGTGLGLAQVYDIVQQHAGYIGVKSRVGKGTTFTIYLPALAVGKEAPEREAAELIPRGRGETVLLVEDEPGVLRTSKAILKHLGYQVLTAAGGHQALKVHATHQDRIDLVLSDMVMPKMGGLELFRLLRERDPTIKMILITGYPLEDGGSELLAQGIVNWVQKPFLLPQLAQVLHRALNGRSP
jgi:two-component system cell cycle sensor histidine kinase/response regulator CckA